MAEEETPPTPPKKVKKALPEAPPEPAPERKLPTAQEIRAAKKAELEAWTESFGLAKEGKVDELRKRVAEYVLKEQKAAAAAVEITAPKPAEAKPVPAVPKEKAPAAEKKPAAKPAPKPTKEAKAKAEKKPAKEEKEEAEEEAGEEETEEEEYEAKQKPKLGPRLERLLAVRALKSASRPAFHRQEWFRYKKFGDEWRKPQGGQSKLRRHFGYRWNLPSIGYRGPREVRGLHPSGFQEVLVHNERQLEGLDPAKQAVRIAHGVGSRKREIIEKACDDKGLRVLNRMVTE